jgi:hypothetical protein
MIDRGRFTNRVRDLSALADRLTKLSALPERATADDFRSAAGQAREAANDLTELLKAQLPGCICRRIQDEGYDYLDYNERCPHHRQLYVLRETLKADYEKMEKKLKNAPRLQLVAAALTGAAATSGVDYDHDVKKALDIADEVLERLTRIE